jgi:hypothetical protein
MKRRTPQRRGAHLKICIHPAAKKTKNPVEFVAYKSQGRQTGREGNIEKEGRNTYKA